jgi:uncharacterized protein YbdZ (MbtH family)
VGGADSKWSKKVLPAGWKVFVEDQSHDARSS